MSVVPQSASCRWKDAVPTENCVDFFTQSVSTVRVDAEERLNPACNSYPVSSYSQIKTVVDHVRGLVCWCRPIRKDYGRDGVFVVHRDPTGGKDATKAEG